MPLSLDNRYKRLKDYRFPEVLMDISASRKTGTLHLKNWPAEKHLHIKKGLVIFATSNLEEDCLGVYLLREKKITVGQFYESVKLIEKTGKRHGAILVELGYLTSEDLKEAVKKQVEEIALGIFEWEDGYIFFEEAGCDIKEQITLDIDIKALIYKGIQRVNSFSHIRHALPLTTVLTLPAASQTTLQKFGFNKNQMTIINLINGQHSVLDILNNTQNDNLETLKFLYAVKSLELALPVDQSSVLKKGTTLNAISIENGYESLPKKGTELFMNGKYAESVKVFKEVVNLQPDKAAYQFYLAMSLVNTLLYDEAEPILKKAIELEPLNDDYYTELGMVYSKLGHPKKAHKTFEFALRLNPHNERARQALADGKK